MNTRNISSEQERAALQASMARKESKLFLRKKVMPFAVVMSIFFTLLFWWKSLPKVEQSAPGHQPQVIQSEAQWKEKMDDGSLPVNVWSESVDLPKRCGITFGGGYGVVYVIQYQYHSDEWKDLNPTDNQWMTNFRYKLLRKGEKVRPYTIECKPKPY